MLIPDGSSINNIHKGEGASNWTENLGWILKTWVTRDIGIEEIGVTSLMDDPYMHDLISAIRMEKTLFRIIISDCVFNQL